VERDHGPPTGCTASFHTTRWGIVMRGAHSQAPVMPHQAETDEEIDALCEPLIASEGRQDP
jgi:hypothetical protein